jgi:transcriptional regulator with GAF, ATPase, and Fis domain
MVQKGQFREDLYCRLDVFPIRFPPLREFLQDIPVLIYNFIT